MNVPRFVRIGVALSMTLASWSTPVWAATATATVTANVASRVSVTLTRDTNSVTRGTTGTVLFDKFDDQDMAGGSAAVMYAPYRSESGKNWHVASIVANGASMTLIAAVTGSAGSVPLSSIMNVWCGGFWEPGAANEIAGTKSTTWEKLDGFSRTLTRPFVGTVPFNYQLQVGTVSSGSYSGTITFTLTSV